MMIFGLIGILLVVYLLYRTDAFGDRRGNSSYTHKDALDILKRRYAEGAIGQEEFERMKKELNER